MRPDNPFDVHTDRYEQWFDRHPYVYRSELNAIKELLPSGEGVEIGVGTGRFAGELGIKYGIEPSSTMAERAAERGIEVTAGVAEDIPFEDSRFDFALMVTAVCFLEDIPTALREIHRILKKNGCIIIGFIDRDSRLGRQYASHQEDNVFYRDATFYSVDQIVAFMAEAGFRNLTFRQTLCENPDKLSEPEPVRKGYGEGSFVVVRGNK